MNTRREARFWALVDSSGGPNACWPWKGSKDKDGYGVFERGLRANRMAFEFGGGKYRRGPMALHTCDNKPCCNPRHLYDGTHARNMADAKARSRFKGGQPNRTCVLDERQRAILAAHKGCAPVKDLASLFGISAPHAYKVLRNKGAKKC